MIDVEYDSSTSRFKPLQPPPASFIKNFRYTGRGTLVRGFFARVFTSLPDFLLDDTRIRRGADGGRPGGCKPVSRDASHRFRSKMLLRDMDCPKTPNGFLRQRNACDS